MSGLHPEQAREHRRLAFDFGLAFNGPASYGVLAPHSLPLPAPTMRAVEADLHVVIAYLEREIARFPVPSFPMMEELLGPRDPGVPEIPPLHAGRFDLVLDGAGEWHLIELNADRNGMQRESMASPTDGAAFRARYLQALADAWHTCGHHRRPPRTVVLIASAYREERALAPFLAATVQQGLGWPCDTASIDNLSVAADRTVMAFGERVDLIVRQYPTEYWAEAAHAEAILRAHRQGRVLVVNPFRSVILQAKSWMAAASAAAWYHPETLTEQEAAVLRRRLPFTAILSGEQLPCDPAEPAGRQGPATAVLLEGQRDWVLKPALGRYSWGVTCGALVSAAEWRERLHTALARPDYWIVQRYVPPAPHLLHRWQNGAIRTVEGYVTYGVHLLGGAIAGWAARCSASVVTDDAWFAPVVGDGPPIPPEDR